MEVDRRSLMKGMLAGGALLALGTPPWTFAESPVRKAGGYGLFLGGSPADEAFARGARAACAALVSEDLHIVKLKDELLAGTDKIARFLERTRGIRWVAVTDDAGAVIFLELTRAAGGRLLSMGTHACLTDGAFLLRHDLAATSPAHSAGGLLASHFIQTVDRFSITEHFLQEPPEEQGGLTSWTAPGFSSYRSEEPEVIHMHCSGLSLPDGCRQLGLETSDGWVPIPPQVRVSEPLTWQSRSWLESVGYAVAASALGIGAVQESCMSRAFVHQSSDAKRTKPAERFVSFVIDV
ncbi:MAG TPA: hypothetical protein VFG71_08260 [Nitrospiraceae bacterium]|nr:hypothetical protein [Nitrospiraceae bacterium]